MPAMNVKVYLFTPRDNSFPKCLVYEDSEEMARASCAAPAQEKNSKVSIAHIEENVYTDKACSDCVEMQVIVNEENQYNGGSMIDFSYENIVYPLAKGIPEYMD